MKPKFEANRANGGRLVLAGVTTLIALLWVAPPAAAATVEQGADTDGTIICPGFGPAIVKTIVRAACAFAMAVCNAVFDPRPCPAR